MNKNNKPTVSDVLNYVFDGESDFGESNESDNEFYLGNYEANANIEEVSENEYDSTRDDEPLACIANNIEKLHLNLLLGGALKTFKKLVFSKIFQMGCQYKRRK